MSAKAINEAYPDSVTRSKQLNLDSNLKWQDVQILQVQSVQNDVLFVKIAGESNEDSFGATIIPLKETVSRTIRKVFNIANGQLSIELKFNKKT